MTARDLLRRVLAPLVVRATEGEYRPGPWQLPVTGGWLPTGVGEFMNWWQLGYNPVGGSNRSAVVEACVSAYAQTIAMCPGDQWRLNSKNGRDRVKTSALSRILRYPNDYQSISDFLLNLTRNLFLDGNAYALGIRNDRYEVSELHLMDSRQSTPQLASTGEVFYRLAGNDVIDRRITGPLIVPQRDVLHVRLHTNGKYPWPLLGMSPLEAAMSDITVGDAMTQQQIQFYLNQARPSAVLSTDLVLDKDQVAALRDRWNDQVRGLGAGGTPILTAGLKVQPWGTPPKDAIVADMAKLSDQRIALAFRVPLQILGIGGTTYSSTEALMQSWISSGLGFALNHIEEAFGIFFGLKGLPDEYVEFSTSVLLRSAFRDRIDGLARGVQGGILSPNEARIEEGYPEVKFGDEPRLQAQVVPLSAAAGIPSAPVAGLPGSIPAAPGGKPAVPVPTSTEKPVEPEAKKPPPEKKGYTDDDVRREVRRVISAAGRIGKQFAP